MNCTACHLLSTSKLVRYWRSGEYTPAGLRRGWRPPHPTLYVRKEWYERIGSFNTGYRIAADYDFILRLFSHPEFKAAYIPEVLVTMRVGGASNRSLGAAPGWTTSAASWLVLMYQFGGGFAMLGFGKGGILPAAAGGLS